VTNASNRDVQSGMGCFIMGSAHQQSN
jgi:hypothetical protein